MKDHSGIGSDPNLKTPQFLVRARFAHQYEGDQVVVVEEYEELAVGMSRVVRLSWQPTDGVGIDLRRGVAEGECLTGE